MNNQINLDQKCVKMLLSQISQNEYPKQVRHSVPRDSCFSSYMFLDRLLLGTLAFSLLSCLGKVVLSFRGLLSVSPFTCENAGYCCLKITQCFLNGTIVVR